MDIKIIKKPSGVPRVSLPCSPQVTDMGAPQVMIQMIFYDAHDISASAGRIVASPQEARDLAKRLLEAAEAAEKQAK